MPNNHEQGMEIFYQMAVTPWFELSADVQVMDGGLGNADTAVIPGIRGRITF